MIRLLPEYRKFENVDDKTRITHFSGEILIAEIDSVDLEDEKGLKSAFDGILELAKHAEQNFTYRFNFVQTSINYNEVGAFRDPFLKGSPHYTYRAFFSVEQRGKLFKKNKNLDSAWPGFKGRSLSEEGFRKVFVTENIRRAPYGLEVQGSPQGVISVYIPNGEGEFSISSLYGAIMRATCDLRISFSFTPISSERAEYIIDKKIGNARVNRVGSGEVQLARLEDLKIRSRSGSETKFHCELKAILTDSTEASLRQNLKSMSYSLKSIGDTYVEGSNGAATAYAASLPGTKQHVPFLEFESGIPFYTPIFREGVPSRRKIRTRAVPLLRGDDSYEDIDIFAPEFSGFNVLINGRPGSGKSVLGNLLSSSLLNDPLVHMVKVDVGGSYVNECKMFGGTEVTFNLNEPSGINPFEGLKEISSNNDAAGIISELVASLCRESAEKILPKSVKTEIESSVKAYIDGKPEKPSFDNFFQMMTTLPRRDILKRFVRGGIFENTFRERSSLELSSRYTYFNFEHIQNASNLDFTQGVIAAVIAKVNVEALKAGNGRTGTARRLVLHNDECQFFLAVNPHYYEVTVANLRKYGHATILMAQSTEAFVVPSLEGFSTGILKNSPIRFFSQVDGEEETFMSRFGLSDKEIAAIRSFSWGQESRSFLLQDELKTRIVRVKLSGEEFWRVTTDRRDREKLEALMRAVPHLSLEEAYRCLSRSI